MDTGDNIMKGKNQYKQKQDKISKRRSISMSTLMIVTVASIALVTLIAVVSIFVSMYQNSIEESAIISSEQAVTQAANTITNYTDDMSELMDMLENNVYGGVDDWEEFIANLLSIRTDIVAVSTYDLEGEMLGCWSDGLELNENALENLSYKAIEEDINSYMLNISSPHVVSIFLNEYPWVVTISELVEIEEKDSVQIAIDIQFSEIASYIDDVGIGQHGYCFIIDGDGNIVYHPQQSLIFSEVKEESIEEFIEMVDGTYTKEDVIYTIQTLENCDWRVVGVSYVDELITGKVESMVAVSITILVMVLLTMIGVGFLFAFVFSRPARMLQSAMEDFEQNAEAFQYMEVGGTKEIIQLSDSFAHMVLRIQRLMEKVRQEEITLRKTELNALQAQINPHFLYNTLDSIAWMCEEERSQEAVEMVNALAKLFRISISRGHELISIDNEVQHARSYLQIQKFRYKNQFTYEIDVEEGCGDYMCNKITLQPIIENAIYHGLDRMVDEGEIYIKISQTEQDIIMEVSDNGVGMSQEQCEEILLREAGDRTGIGIKNVHDRVQIYFGEGYGLHIESELDEGTKVIIRTPKIEKGEYYEEK